MWCGRGTLSPCIGPGAMHGGEGRGAENKKNITGQKEEATEKTEQWLSSNLYTP